MDSSALDVRWWRFLNEPSAYVGADRLAACFGGEISLPGCKNLLAAGRLRQRLSRRLVEHYRLPEPEEVVVANEDREVALLDSDQLGDLALRSGAIFWSASLAAIIEKEKAAALQAELGSEVAIFCLRHRDLSASVRPLPSLAELLDRVNSDGRLCFHAWLSSMPGAVSARISLKLSGGMAAKQVLTAEHKQSGPAIVRRAIEGVAR